jgi:hypothetical protein
VANLVVYAVAKVGEAAEPTELAAGRAEAVAFDPWG